MKYSEIRPSLKSGDIIAFTSRAPAFSSWHNFKVAMVQSVTRSQYSHVATVWIAGGRVFVIEAVMPRVRIYPLSLALDEGEDCFHLPTHAKWCDGAEDFAMAHIGQPYSQLKAMVSSFRPWAHGDFTECAGLTIDILCRAGVPLGIVATPSAVVREAQLRGATCTLITN